LLAIAGQFPSGVPVGSVNEDEEEVLFESRSRIGKILHALGGYINLYAIYSIFEFVQNGVAKRALARLAATPTITTGFRGTLAVLALASHCHLPT
jgi:hypothetical protein